jgi:hypothetical protein
MPNENMRSLNQKIPLIYGCYNYGGRRTRRAAEVRHHQSEAMYGSQSQNPDRQVKPGLPTRIGNSGAFMRGADPF